MPGCKRDVFPSLQAHTPTRRSCTQELQSGWKEISLQDWPGQGKSQMRVTKQACSVSERVGGLEDTVQGGRDDGQPGALNRLEELAKGTSGRWTWLHTGVTWERFKENTCTAGTHSLLRSA